MDAPAAEPLEHLVTRASREGDGKHPRWIHSPGAHERLDAARKHRGLAAACARDAHDTILRSGDRSLLLVRQAVEQRAVGVEALTVIFRDPIGLNGERLALRISHVRSAELGEREHTEGLSRVGLDVLDELVVAQTIDHRAELA